MARQAINLGTTDNDGTGDSLKTAGDKIEDNFVELYGVSSGNLAGTELTFDTKHRKYTKTITVTEALTLAASGNVADSYITLTTTGNGVNVLSFPSDWIMKGDAFNASKIQEIGFKYTGTYVVGYILTLDDIA